MSFERTVSGQANRSTFLEVDLVCYVEGGGGRADFGPDSAYWNTVFRTVRPELKVKFLARGGKPVLQSLAQDIIKNDIKKTIVAMDLDYDELIGKKITDSRVLYTYGYSWENDLFFRENIEELCSALARQPELPNEVRDYLGAAVVGFSSNAQRAMLADFLALCSGASVLPRDAPGRVIKKDEVTGLPVCAMAEIKKLIRQANLATKNRRIIKYIKRPDRDIRYFVGRVLGFAMRIIILTCIRKFYRNVNISPEHFIDVAIQVVSRHLNGRAENYYAVHYTKIINGVPA